MSEEDRVFVEPEPEALQCSVSSIHIDATNEIYSSPSTRMQRIFNLLGGAVLNKVRRRMIQYVSSAQYRDLVDIHIHVDISMHTPLQKRFTKAAETPVNDVNHDGGARVNQDGIAEADVHDPTEAGLSNSKRFDADSELDRVDSRTAPKMSWSSLIRDEGNREHLTSLHAVLMAKSTVLLHEERDGVEIDEGATEGPGMSEEIVFHSTNTASSTKSCEVFIHGASIAISDAARHCQLKNLAFLRYGEAVVVVPSSNSDSEVEVGTPSSELKYNLSCVPIVNDNMLSEDITLYDPSVCWNISSTGIRRHGESDRSHGQAQTRFDHSILNVTQKRFFSLQLPRERWKVLMVSNQVESPLITTLCSDLNQFNVIHKLEEDYVDTNKLKKAPCDADVSERDLALLFSLAGCDECPSTLGVKQRDYVATYSMHRKEIGRLYDPRNICENSEFNLYDWIQFEIFVGLSREKVRQLSDEDLQFLQQNRHAWPHILRRRVAKIEHVQCPSLLMPEREDFELQVRRAKLGGSQLAAGSTFIL